MTGNGCTTDLVVLVADRNMMASISGLLDRPASLGIRPVAIDVYVHPQHDPGCLLKSDAFLRPFQGSHAHALVVFDRMGCGREHQSRERLQDEVLARLASSGWDDRAGVVVIDPELEVWVWSDSPEVDAALGWRGELFGLRNWLVEQGLLAADKVKPTDPKAAVERALREVRKPRSSSIYRDLASRVSLQRCGDGAFLHLKDLLQVWFCVETACP